VNLNEQFRTPEAWRGALGLVPIPLRDTDNAQRFALFNGSVGNFCLDFVGGLKSDDRCIAAWSADVGHYLTIDHDRVVLNRWDRRGAEEYFSLNSVLGRLHDFHRFLENDSPGRAQSVVAHVLQVFRQIRSIVKDDQNGARSLKVFIALLALTASENDRGSGAVEKLGLTEETVAASLELTDAMWASLQRDLFGLGKFEATRPDISLMLRHASGTVFQEAHRAALLATSLWIPGLEQPASMDAKSKPEETGIFFTPPAIARTLAEEATLLLDNFLAPRIRIFDPACGSGELLKECLRHLNQKGFGGIVEVIGWDKSEASIDMARFVLTWEKRTWRPGQVTLDLRTTDSLTADPWPNPVDLVIMNPPFLSRQLMSNDQKEATIRVLEGRHINRPNLAMVFALRALEAVGDGGVLAMIAPNSLLESSSGRPIREELASRLTPLLLARLGNQNIFADALVDAGLYIGKRTPSNGSKTAVVWSDAQPTSLSQALRALRRWRGSESEPTLGAGFSVYLRDDLARSGAPWVARDFRAWQFFKAFSGNRNTIPAKKLFRIKQGVRMGSDLFIVSQSYHNKLLEGEKRFFRPAVMNPSFQDGTLLRKYFIFYPKTVGLPDILDDHDLETYLPTYFRDVLAPNKEKLGARRSLHEGHHWWELSEHRGWLEERKPRLISKYFGSDRSFAYDETGDFVVVVGNGWVLEDRAIGESNLTDSEIYLGMLAFLNSTVFSYLAMYSSVQISGGQFDLSNRYVENLPIPNPSKNMEAFRNLVDAGTRILRGEKEIWTTLTDVVMQSIRA
jgi:adenine-specific DNA-methyltransferase